MKAVIVLLACLTLVSCGSEKTGAGKTGDEGMWAELEKHIDCRWSYNRNACLCVYRDKYNRGWQSGTDSVGIAFAPDRVCGH